MGTIELLHLGAGAALAAAGWLIPRHIAGARRLAVAALLLDAAPLALGAVLLALATGRPLFAGVIVLALGAGFALVDQTMRQTLREPVVFSESVELPQVFSHPHLYLPFAGPGLVIGGAVAADRLRRLMPSGELFADAAALGPFAMLLVHLLIARAERPARRKALGQPPAAPMPLGSRGEPATPIIL